MINDDLKAWHLKNLHYNCSKSLYERLCAACEKRPGGVTDADQDLIYDACFMEDVKEGLRDDILGRGAVATIRNGSQVFKKDNKSVTQLRAYMDSQRKMFAELRITPAKRGAAEAAEDSFDAM